MQAFAYLSLIPFLTGAAFSQTAVIPAKLPMFEAADVHVSAHAMNRSVSTIALPNGRCEWRDATMLDLIRSAYGVEAGTVFGGPNWLELDRFDVIVKAPVDSTPETRKLMLRSLLADRFKLEVHDDRELLPRFVLAMAKGYPKLKAADASAAKHGCQEQPPPRERQPVTVPDSVVSCRHVTMAEFAEQLQQLAPNYLNRAVVDQTGLTGTWDFDIRWTSRGRLLTAGQDGISVFDAVDRQLGLKLELRKVPAAALVVDGVNQKPTANLPGVSSILPPLPAEFDVADIKPSSLLPAGGGPSIQNGRVNLHNRSLKSLIMLAWDIDSEMLVGGPKRFDTDQFDVIARSDAIGTSTNLDLVRPMLQKLLIDKFKLVVHYEKREAPAYVLIAVTPKLTISDPSSRMGCREEQEADGNDPRYKNPILSRLVSCQNVTMSQFADILPRISFAYVQAPVLDATGLDGTWDFRLSFSPAGVFNVIGGRIGDGGPTAGALAGVPEASDTGGGLSIFEALSKQLGLKLEKQKRPIPVLVIDHVEQKPDN